MRITACCLLACLFAAAPCFAQEEDPLEAHARLYAKVAPSVAYVRGKGQNSTGFFIRSDGILATTSTVAQGDTVTVQTPQHKRYNGRVIGSLPSLELALVKIPGDDHPVLELGDSDAAKVGQVVYALGDSFGSIWKDDQVAMSVGVLSGRYELEGENVPKTYARNRYLGEVLETSAAVNQNQDGGPLVDAKGRVLGMITLNYDKSKFTGVAVPAGRLKEGIRRLLRAHDGGEAPEPVAGGPGWFGVHVRENANGLEVVRVSPEGPADRAGIERGDVITLVNGEKALRVSTLRELEEKAVPGSTVALRILREGKAVKFALIAQKKRVY